MIAVIADDFTGAAELAGISLRYGLSVTVYLDTDIDDAADVVVVSTNSRSMQKAAAVYCTAEATEAVLRLQPALLYKKIDSVLRGYVTDELNVQMELAGKSKAFLLPANPSLNRTIRNGEYFIGEKKITETGFINDPEFPVRSARITEMLQYESVQVAKHQDWLPTEGMVVGEAATAADVQAWVSVLDASWMVAGAGDFFTALLQKKYKEKEKQAVSLQLPLLYVCGTAFEERKQFVKGLPCVAYMPEIITEEWLQQTTRIIQQQKKLVIAIDETNATAADLRKTMAAAVREIVAAENIKEIFIEGGSTAAAVLEELNSKKLIPVNELSRGVVRMKAGNLFITVKPGSYELPEEIKNIFISHR